jgi:hypothetical protein
LNQDWRNAAKDPNFCNEFDAAFFTISNTPDTHHDTFVFTDDSIHLAWG